MEYVLYAAHLLSLAHEYLSAKLLGNWYPLVIGGTTFLTVVAVGTLIIRGAELIVLMKKAICCAFLRATKATANRISDWASAKLAKINGKKE